MEPCQRGLQSEKTDEPPGLRTEHRQRPKLTANAGPNKQGLCSNKFSQGDADWEGKQLHACWNQIATGLSPTASLRYDTYDPFIQWVLWVTLTVRCAMHSVRWQRGKTPPMFKTQPTPSYAYDPNAVIWARNTTAITDKTSNPYDASSGQSTMAEKDVTLTGDGTVQQCSLDHHEELFSTFIGT